MKGFAETRNRVSRAPSRPFFSKSASNLNLGHDFFTVTPLVPRIQAKKIGKANDVFEQEADRIAERVVRMPELKNGSNERHGIQPATPVQRAASNTAIQNAEAQPATNDALHSEGRPLDQNARTYMEPRFNHDFSQVRVHVGSNSARSASSINAKAYTAGRDIVFGSGQYQPHTQKGKKLLAHELTHVVQQSKANSQVVQRDRYSRDEREEMSQSQISSTPLDVQVANQCNFQPGDIVFRLGSRELASRMGEPVTHGGIYLGGGLIHDMVGFGNRTVPVVEFYAEAADPDVVRVIRFNGPLRSQIVAQVVANVNARNFDLPTDPVPWNLFSTSTDYNTATCLEYSHAQFLHAIRTLLSEPAHADIHDQLRTTYFTSGSATPDNLIEARRLRGSWPVGTTAERWLLVAAADYLAEDVDPGAFRNRWEGNEDESIDAFTYRSFVNATQFFQAIDCPDASGDASVRYNRQILPISAPVTQNRTDPVDRTVTNQVGIVWAEQGGNAFLTQISIVNSSTSRQRTQIFFRTFVDQDLRSRAITRALRHQPRGIQTLPWNVIAGIPSRAPANTAQRNE